MPLSTVSGILTRHGMGRLGRLGLERRSATSAHGRASSSTSTSRSSAGSRRRRQARGVTAPSSTTADTHRRAPACVATPSAGSTSTSPIDDYSRLAYAEVLADEKAVDRGRLPPPRRRLLPPPRHPGRAGPDRQRQPLPRQPSTRSPAAPLGIRHLRTRPYRPQTNGKAERFIRTMLNGWAYGAIYRSSHERTPPLTAGSGTTTIDADTQPSATNPRSAEPTCSGPTASSRGRTGRGASRTGSGRPARSARTAVRGRSS